MKMNKKRLNNNNNWDYAYSTCYYNSTKLLPQWSKVRVCNVNK